MSETVFSTADAVHALVNAGLVSAGAVESLGTLTTGNFGQHLMNVEMIIRPLGIDYAAAEQALGFPAGSLASSVFVPPVVAPVAPARSFAEVMEEAKRMREASAPRVDPVAVQALSQQIGELWAKLQYEMSKKW